MLPGNRQTEPIPSATLILFRPAGEKYQIYLLRRSRKSGFMAGTWVFPGGMLDNSDLNIGFWLDRIDLAMQKIDGKYGWGETTGRTLGYLVAAVRETFEEAGVLLAAGEYLEPDEVAEFQIGCRNNEAAFEKFLFDRDLSLRLSAMSPWSHWVTPKGMKNRYETRFFIARLPSGSVCRPEPGETPEGIWIDPRSALEENAACRLQLSPPAVVTLHQMLSFETVHSLQGEIRHRKWGQTIMPRMVCGEKGDLLIQPWDPEYNDEYSSRLPGALLPVGTPFSRMWCHDGFWLPVG